MDTLFLDANILFTAAYSEIGASRALFELARRNRLVLISSRYAIIEAQHNIQKKLTEKHLVVLFKLIAELKIVDDSKWPIEEIRKYEEIIITKDIPILLAAEKREVQFLITLDKKYFKSAKMRSVKLPFAIMSPGEYLQSL